MVPYWFTTEHCTWYPGTVESTGNGKGRCNRGNGWNVERGIVYYCIRYSFCTWSSIVNDRFRAVICWMQSWWWRWRQRWRARLILEPESFECICWWFERKLFEDPSAKRRTTPDQLIGFLGVRANNLDDNQQCKKDGRMSLETTQSTSTQRISLPRRAIEVCFATFTITIEIDFISRTAQTLWMLMK